MNYPESQEILKRIKKAKKILINCHISPDADSVGSALSMSQVLKKMDKDVRVICPDNLPDNLDFLPLYKSVEKVDFTKIHFSNYDLFLMLDSSDWNRVVDGVIPMPDISTVVIDHHKTEDDNFGDIRLVDPDIGSTAELLYLVFEDWSVKLDKNIATTLLTGIIGDTGAFQFPNTTSKTFEITVKLMRLGANKNEIIFNLFRRYSFGTMKLWGKMLGKLKFEEKEKFVWLALSYSEYSQLDISKDAKSQAASLFLQGIDGSDFGIIIVENQDNTTSVSLRSRTGLDVSLIAQELGGGGHAGAAGAKLRDIPFNKAVGRVLESARKFAKQNG